MVKKQTFKDRLAILMKGERPYTWARQVGIEKGLFQYYWQKGKIPTYENLLKIQKHTGCSIDWLLTGKQVATEVVDIKLVTSAKPKDQRLQTQIVAKVATLTERGDAGQTLETVDHMLYLELGRKKKTS